MNGVMLNTLNVIVTVREQKKAKGEVVSRLNLPEEMSLNVLI